MLWRCRANCCGAGGWELKSGREEVMWWVLTVAVQSSRENYCACSLPSEGECGTRIEKWCVRCSSSGGAVLRSRRALRGWSRGRCSWGRSVARACMWLVGVYRDAGSRFEGKRCRWMQKWQGPDSHRIRYDWPRVMCTGERGERRAGPARASAHRLCESLSAF